MHEAVEVPRRFLDGFPHIVVDVHVEDVRDEVERILIIGYFGIKAGEVEAIGQVVFVDLAEVLVSAGRYELKSVN